MKHARCSRPRDTRTFNKVVEDILRHIGVAECGKLAPHVLGAKPTRTRHYFEIFF
jgi:hypothetical protein